VWGNAWRTGPFLLTCQDMPGARSGTLRMLVFPAETQEVRGLAGRISALPPMVTILSPLKVSSCDNIMLVATIMSLWLGCEERLHYTGFRAMSPSQRFPSIVWLR
jgi:hypothetical protein